MNQIELLNRITRKIRQSLESQDILDAAVTEVRDFLKTDRVKIYKFDEDGNGQVIAESINGDHLPSLKGLHFPAGDIPPRARELFLKARVRSIVDLEEQQICLSQPDRLPSTATDELTVEQVRQSFLDNLLQRPVDPCHVEYLTLMGVKSSLVVPLVCNEELWGLLIAHHRRAKALSKSHLKIIQIVSEQLEMAITQANLFNKVQQKAQREALINQISQLLHSPLENDKILPTVLSKIVPAIGGTGGLLCMNGAEKSEISFYQYGSLPNLSTSDWLQLQGLALNDTKVRVIDNIEEQKLIKTLLPALKKNKLRSLLLMTLRYKQETLGNLAIFRRSIDTEKLWAGNYQDDERQQRPRQSFAEWKELTQGKAQPWKLHEMELIESLGNNLGIAVMQDRLYRQERKQRLLVEMQNQELENARREAEKASSLKSAFLSSSSHELRTPLASVLNYLKLLKEGFYDNEEELLEYIETAHTWAENLHYIVNNILDIAKIEAGKMEADLEIVELKPLLKEQYKLFQSETIRQGIELTVDCQVISVCADKIKLKQVLGNLLNNAFKFTQQGEINLKAISKSETTSSKEKSLVEISLADTGIGIEPDKQTNIFDAFVQEDSSIHRRYGGTGLGLTICKELVELMGGEILLFSEGRNRGTTITVTLPRAEE
ncbi:ATP-binding protein [Mastigocoleus testarum]|uniref:Circadian input-output histidine kinase CikA n=1 Tax=Mastigocoleus testarum BC008 TaxID=371196 RepID=A0A0V7ZLY1_9CYAN|nr:ATP-binding protein [Mastigocoleus testarum]KST65378.1 histidine kinase [Mastigocoleus testarum BC008]KST70442.1 histidine kinase [Mastigocoleus testarum BC008]